MSKAIVLMGVWFALTASVGNAQDVPPPGIPSTKELERSRQQLEELKRANEEYMRAVERERIDAEATLARLGGSVPWPPADPPAATPEAWRNALLAAPRSSAAEVLATVTDLRINVRRSPDVAALFASDQDLMVRAITSVHAAGYNTHPDRVVSIELGCSLHSLESVDGSTSAQTVVSEAYLLVPARILRGDRVFACKVHLGTYFDVRKLAGRATRDDVGASLDRAAGGLLRSIQAASEKPAEPGPFSAWLADVDSTRARQTAFQDSQRPEEGLEAGLSEVSGFLEVRCDSLVPPNAEPSAVAGLHGAQHQQWLGWLTNVHLPTGVAGAPVWVHRFSAENVDPSVDPSGLASPRLMAARAAMLEPECLVNLGQSWIRITGESWSHSSLHWQDSAMFEGDSDAHAPFVQAFHHEAAESAIAAFLSERERGGATPVPPHPDGEAVANFLRTRARLEVPEAVLMDFSNLVARTLAEAPGIPESMRAEWILEVQGELQYDLPRVGQARSGTALSRSIRTAIENAVDAITLADPMAQIAFYDIWMHDRGYRRPVLPDDFAQELCGPRPNGPGALYDVRVVDAYEHAFRALDSMDFKERAPFAEALVTIRPQLAGARVLVCSYIPENGSMSYTLERAFWYREAPTDWKKLAAKLPEALPIRNLTAARLQAPKTLAAAEPTK